MQLESVKETEYRQYFSVLSLSQQESGLLASFEEHVESIGRYGIALPDTQAKVGEHPFVYELFSYFEDAAKSRPLGFYFMSKDGERPASITIESGPKMLEFWEMLIAVTPKIKFSLPESSGFITAEGYLDERDAGKAVYDPVVWTSLQEVIKDGVMLVARNGKERYEGQKVYANGFGIGIAPETYLPQGLEQFTKVLSTLKTEDAQALMRIKREIWKQQNPPYSDKAMAEALELGYRVKLEASLESLLEYSEFPLMH